MNGILTDKILNQNPEKLLIWSWKSFDLETHFIQSNYMALTDFRDRSFVDDVASHIVKHVSNSIDLD